ncbi:AGC family protein kinase [Trichomonas vaginalis G3]|uniref:AGC family protein kinase n=1 Tax=Trichomonas vaginalis (strain ATCC PRA-98 / G3) TaxID=412133 RepID=A2EI78_TRIV3|nr:protein serine/threonine kinase protein [Trichomonas vaginalis G3]EAY07638.1 AGC family protein kinase [Trichomonas vaginalis G3]KAI5500514.1 protein serine/threonine kinase protein [Trichomonas vaginalis G3]|eukprot:XP_001319861.1 AGC family protein kinase [Trichomonas vaginalis G3]
MNNLSTTGGWLSKRGLLGIWSQRYCKLIGTQLVISKSEKINNSEQTIEINPNAKIQIVSDQKKPRFFLEDTNGETALLEAKSTQEMMQWVLLLRGATFWNPDLNMDYFEVISVIGQGYYGKVRLVKSKADGELFAIKSIRKSKLIEQKEIKTVLNERNIMIKADHPFIVQLKFAFQSSSKFYLGLEYVPGGELFAHIKRDGFLHEEEYKLVLAQVALVLNHLHSIGVIYRDMKPENIMIGQDGYIKLTDFGLAKDITVEDTTSTFCGTPDYIAPEVVRGLNYDKSVDWWALGILAFELMYHRTPFHSQNRDKTYRKIVNDSPKFPEYASEVEKSFIMGLLNKEPKQRFGFKEVKEHQFFGNINFDDVLAKKIQPYYVPQIEDPTNVKYFDAEFTNETKADSFVAPIIGDEAVVPGFSYVECDSILAPSVM